MQSENNVTNKITKGEGVTTLINMGNTCFMNSALQCLLHTEPIVDFFHRYTIIDCNNCKSQINLLRLAEERIPGSIATHCPHCHQVIDLCDNPLENTNPKNESLAVLFVKSVRSLCVGYWEENCRVKPETFYKVFSVCLQKIFNTEVFRLGDQQDSQECLVYILDLLHMGLSREVNIQMNSNEAPHLAWVNHIKKNNHSFLIDNIYGLTRTCVECQQCKTISKRFDPVSSISLSFPPNLKDIQSITLEDMFRFYSYPEMLVGENKYDCDKCKEYFHKNNNNPQEKYPLSEAKKKIEVWMFPSTLILDFKRYKVEMFKFPNGQVGMKRNKINTLVRCPLEIDLGQFLPNQIVKGGSKNNVYELYAAIYHSGVLQGGHYVAACKVDGQGWVKFDDAESEQLSEDTVVNSRIYVAFYRRKK